MKKVAGCTLSLFAGLGLMTSAIRIPDSGFRKVETASAVPNWTGGSDPQAWVPLLPATTVAPQPPQSVDSRLSEPVRRRGSVATATRSPTARPAAPASSAGGCVAPGPPPPAYIAQRESGGSYTARNASGAGGKFQIMPGTWASVGGTGNAADASPAEQECRAAMLWNNGAGSSHWAATR